MEIKVKDDQTITGAFTRAEKTSTASTTKKSDITDHVCNKKHLIDWDSVKVIHRESDKRARLIREALWIRRSSNGTRGATN